MERKKGCLKGKKKYELRIIFIFFLFFWRDDFFFARLIEKLSHFF